MATTPILNRALSIELPPQEEIKQAKCINPRCEQVLHVDFGSKIRLHTTPPEYYPFDPEPELPQLICDLQCLKEMTVKDDFKKWRLGKPSKTKRKRLACDSKHCIGDYSDLDIQLRVVYDELKWDYQFHSAHCFREWFLTTLLLEPKDNNKLIIPPLTPPSTPPSSPSPNSLFAEVVRRAKKLRGECCDRCDANLPGSYITALVGLSLLAVDGTEIPSGPPGTIQQIDDVYRHKEWRICSGKCLRELINSWGKEVHPSSQVTRQCDYKYCTSMTTHAGHWISFTGIPGTTPPNKRLIFGSVDCAFDALCGTSSSNALEDLVPVIKLESTRSLPVGVTPVSEVKEPSQEQQQQLINSFIPPIVAISRETPENRWCIGCSRPKRSLDYHKSTEVVVEVGRQDDDEAHRVGFHNLECCYAYFQRFGPASEEKGNLLDLKDRPDRHATVAQGFECDSDLKECLLGDWPNNKVALIVIRYKSVFLKFHSFECAREAFLQGWNMIM